MSNNSISKLIELLKRINRMKQVPRTGWLLRGVNRSDGDSVAEHISMTGIISMFLGSLIDPKGDTFDHGKIAQLALIHDLPEVMTGDLDRGLEKYFGKQYQKIKQDAEHSAIQDLFSDIESNTHKQFRALWLEYSTKTPEAKIVQIADRIEAGIQVLAYLDMGYSKENFTPFILNLEQLAKDIEWVAIKNVILDLIADFDAFG